MQPVPVTAGSKRANDEPHTPTLPPPAPGTVRSDTYEYPEPAQITGASFSYLSPNPPSARSSWDGSQVSYASSHSPHQSVSGTALRYSQPDAVNVKRQDEKSNLDQIMLRALSRGH